MPNPLSSSGRSLTKVPGAVQDKPSELYYIQKDQKGQASALAMTTRERNIPSNPTTQPQATPPAPATQEEAVAPSIFSPAAKPQYFVIVGSYVSRAAAQNVVNDLQSKGYPATIIPNGQGRFRIGCQGYATLQEAKQNIEAIKNKLNGPAWILNIQTGQPAQ
ncbi:MAG: SPOR domain-containing protein [Bacteroidota bacterium]